MMASNILSRLLPTNPSGRSIYDDLRAHDEGSESDLEERAGLALDEENLNFQDDDLRAADVFNGEESRLTTESTAFLTQQQRQPRGKKSSGKSQAGRSKWVAQSPRLLGEDGDDDVPASLLIEGNELAGPSSAKPPRARPGKNHKRGLPVPGPSSRENRAHWEVAQAQQRLHQDDGIGGPISVRNSTGPLSSNAREKAMWRWINTTNLDIFIREVYDYYNGAGMWTIILERVLNLAQIIFVAIFSTFLTQCVNYTAIPGSTGLSDVLVPHCTKKISGFPNVVIWLFTLHVLWRIYQLLVAVPHLLRIRDFYLYLLEIPESDMQTVSWQDVVARIMALRDSNPVTAEKISPSNRRYLGSQSKQRLDAHDIANRLMRRENYLIAIFNKEILDLTLNLPFLGGRQFFSRALLWNIDWCIMDLIFNDLGQVSQLILKDSHRRQLSDALRTRFLFAGYMNVLLAPGIIIYLLVSYFFRYFAEYQKNIGKINARRYTPLAEWKFREFNELEHLFQKRINMSYPFASRYLDQFPKQKTALVCKFVAFVSGAIFAVLAVATLWDSELFLGFEITKERNAFFFMTVTGGIWAAANGMIPEENLVFEPEYALRQVIEYTHYMPSHWQNRLHSDEIKRDFATLYQMKLVIFLEEVLSIIVTPFILWFSLPKCSDQIIDFFREFTIHVDGVGYVCSFAVFDFKKGDGRKATLHGGGSADARDEYYSTKHGKMAASYYGFLDNYLLNPKTAVQGHIPPGQRHQFHPPPSFPGMMSPTLGAEMQSSRLGRSERRPGSRNPAAMPPRTPRFPPSGTHGSPMQSILLDPHHQPSNSGFGVKSLNRTSRSKYQVRQNIIEEPIEDDEEGEDGGRVEESVVGGLGMDESRWETSAGNVRDEEEDEGDKEPAGGGGVLGLLYQFQKAQTDGRPGVNI